MCAGRENDGAVISMNGSGEQSQVGVLPSRETHIRLLLKVNSPILS
jgi:hypothetical protein